MFFWITVKVALRSLLANKLRSFLAMLGIIFGVGAVIAMLAIAEGAKKQVLERVSAMGSNLLIIRPGQGRMGGVSSGDFKKLTLTDAKILLTEIQSIDAVAPVVSGNVQVKYFNRNTRTSLLGTTETYFPLRNISIDKGRGFAGNETESLARMALLGPVTATNLFGETNPVEEIIKIKGINFRVIGVLKAKGDQGYFNPDDQIIIPYKTAMKQVLGVDSLREIDIQVSDQTKLEKVIEQATQILRKKHKLTDKQPDDFNIRNQAEILETASGVSQTFSILLGGIASISLLVGGIGIMNIMLVTVTERTREIGIRKAIGAKEKDILRQFLFESLVMSFLGGLFGMIVGVSAAVAIGKFTDFQTIINFQGVLIAMGFAMGVGIFFGYYPAKRAARLDPIEALRYE